MINLFKIFLLSFAVKSTFAQQPVRESYTLEGKDYQYYILRPTTTAKGILFLFPGKGENPKSLFDKTKVPSNLSQKGLLTIVPELEYTLFANDITKKLLEEILKIQSKNNEQILYNLNLGGFSAGGALALSYGEYLLSVDSNSVKSIFIIDPPIDLERLYKSAERFTKYNCHTNIIRREGRATMGYLESALSGPPSSALKNYIDHSPFLASQPDGGNAKWLRNVPIRMYTEPDIDFIHSRYCQEITLKDLNVVDLENLNQLLKKMGNKNAEYIVTKGRGYHNWGIAEPDELADWISPPSR